MTVVEIAAALNEELLDVQSDRFVTFAVGWLDCATGLTKLINCGHGPVLFIPDNGGASAVFERRHHRSALNRSQSTLWCRRHMISAMPHYVW